MISNLCFISHSGSTWEMINKLVSAVELRYIPFNFSYFLPYIDWFQIYQCCNTLLSIVHLSIHVITALGFLSSIGNSYFILVKT